MSKLETPMRVVLEFNEAFNNHDIAGMMRLMREDCKIENAHPAPDGLVYDGKETVTQFWRDFFDKSPQVHIEIEEIFGMGDRCIMRWKCVWGEANEIGYVRGVDVYRIRNGLISEKLSYVKG